MVLVIRRPAPAENGIEPPGGIAISSAIPATTPIAEAISATTSAWNTTPTNNVQELAPIAFSTPYSPTRSTVMRAKNSATTSTPIETVTPMIWLNVVCCAETPVYYTHLRAHET